MKQLLLILLTNLLFARDAAAQTSLPKEMIQQIIALKTFLKHVKQGYNIVSNGLQTVNRIKDGDLRLHALQFDHLQQVSPAVSRYASLYGLALSQSSLLLTCNKLFAEIKEQKNLSQDEQDFCKRVVTMLLHECKQSIYELIQLLTVNELGLTDDERLNRLRQLQQKTIRLEASVHSLREDVVQLSLNRINERRNVQHSKQLNKLP